MTVSLVPERLDVAAFARAQAELRGEIPATRLERLAQEFPPGAPAEGPVHWTAHGDERTAMGGKPQAWLHLQAAAGVPLTCQRCLQPAVLPLAVDRWFRFVADEVTAISEDDTAEEDVLVLSRHFDLIALIEDELLMAVPLVPMHDACPTELPRSAVEQPPPSAESSHPFAVLAQLKR